MIRFGAGYSPHPDSSEAARRALAEAAPSGDLADAAAVLVHVTMGHDHGRVLDTLRAVCPRAAILGGTANGLIHLGGANESPRALGLMVLWGEPGELRTATSPHLDSHNAREEATRLAEAIHTPGAPPTAVLVMTSGLDIAANAVIEGIQEVFGPRVPVIGSTASDAMLGHDCAVFADPHVRRQAAFVLAFADPTLHLQSGATHGFVPTGLTVTVTTSAGNHIQRLDDAPAWDVYTAALGLPRTARIGDVIPPGALGVDLPRELARPYGDPQILRVVARRDDLGGLYLPVDCPPGTRLHLMRRDEDHIFDNLDRLLDGLRQRLEGRRPAAVLHADCGARGRKLLDRVSKDEILERMQRGVFGDTPGPWLGAYGFGEFTPIDGRNCFHNYTTSLHVFCRG